MECSGEDPFSKGSPPISYAGTMISSSSSRRYICGWRANQSFSWKNGTSEGVFALGSVFVMCKMYILFGLICAKG